MNREAFERGWADAVGASLTCRAVEDAMTDYLDGALSAPHLLWFHVHLGFCVCCRRTLDQLKVFVARLGRLPAAPVSPAMRLALVQQFRARKVGAVRPADASP